MRPVALGVLLLLAACGPPPGTPTERVIVPPGATVRAVGESLTVHQVIDSPRWFRIMARVGGYSRRIKSGVFELPRGAGVLAALRTIADGRSALLRFTVPEGFTLLDIAVAAERDLGIPRAEVLAAARDTAMLRNFEIPAPSFEGFLLPETYLFAPGISAPMLVRTLAETFRNTWSQAWTDRAGAQGLDRLTVVTLASLVEGEAVVDSDRPLIAAVYRNRLRLGMPLQADPTVQYAIQSATGERKTRLFDKDYTIPSPYNTYLHPGLPPGPVGAPSRKSIEAVLEPAPVPYLYFVAGPDGRHIFTRTYQEHLRAVARVRARR